MVDITHKISSLREATASGKVYFSKHTFELIEKNEIPKGNIFEFAKSAAFFAAKKTDDLLPHCHPVTIDSMSVDLKLGSENEQYYVSIESTAKSIGRTGIEMEVLTGVSIAALTVYDMLKPVDKNLLISDIKLLDKKGGKSDRKYFNTAPSCAILICSSEILAQKREDVAGVLAKTKLENVGITDIEYIIIDDSKEKIKSKILELVSNDIAFIFTIGGTGLGHQDITVNAVNEILEQKAEGIISAMYQHGQQRSAVAMMSQATAGTIANTTIITIPGSATGAKECLESILPAIFHARKMLKNR